MEALQTEGALLSLRTLNVHDHRGVGLLSQLAIALMGGTAPQLQEIIISGNVSNSDLEAVAHMLEARARNPGWEGLHFFSKWVNNAPIILETQPRLLRVLLPSLRKLCGLMWDDALVPCFVEVNAPHLTTFDVDVPDGTLNFWKALVAAPALASIKITSFSGLRAAWQSLTAALRHGALQELQELSLDGYDVRDGVARDLMDAVEGSGCSKRLVCMSLGMTDQVLHAMIDLFRRDNFPALQDLCLYNITNEGIAVLAEALLEARQTFLGKFTIHPFGLRDEGFAAVAPLVYHGRFQQLKHREISTRNQAFLTNEGIIPLARAIDSHGLPMLECFSIRCTNS